MGIIRTKHVGRFAADLAISKYICAVSFSTPPTFSISNTFGDNYVLIYFRSLMHKNGML
jgi:hypothetical protein